MQIAVVGAGVVGLTTAIRLRQSGHSVTVYAAARSPNVTSNRAGAVYTPFRAAASERTRRWTTAAYRELCALANQWPAEHGVSMTTLREYAFTDSPGVPWWAECVEGFRTLAPPSGFAAVYEARVPRMAMGRYLPRLERWFVDELGGRIIDRRVNELAELLRDDTRVVVNCSGLGARELAHDPAVRPMRGQVLHIRNTLGLRDCVVEEGRGDTTTYIFPFEDYIVLGGTYERGQERDETDEPTLASIRDRCRNLLRTDGFARWNDLRDDRIRAVAGLRPARVIDDVDECVRLEAEPAQCGRVIIHNYGHGRAGVTFSWACAADVAAIVAGISEGDS